MRDAEPAPPTASRRQSRSGRHRRPERAAVSWRDVCAEREFRALWSAQALSSTGDQVAQVAIALVVYARTGSPLLTAVTYVLTYLPPIAGRTLAPACVRRAPGRRAVIALGLARALLAAGMTAPHLPLAALCALLSGTALLGPPFSAARTALQPHALPPHADRLGSAIGAATQQVSQIVGFAGGAVAVVILGFRPALAGVALGFAVSAAVVAARVTPQPAPALPAAPDSRWWAATRGAAFVVGHRRPRALALFGWLAGFTVVPEGLAIPYAHALNGGALTAGLLMAAAPAGVLAGAVLLGRLTRPPDRPRLIGWLAVLSCAPLVGSLANPPLAILLPLWALAGAGGAYQFCAAAAFARAVPPRARPGAFGAVQTGLLAAQGLGILLAGGVAERVAPQTAVAGAGLVGVIAAAALASSWASLCEAGAEPPLADRAAGHPGVAAPAPAATAPSQVLSHLWARAAPPAGPPAFRAPASTHAGPGEYQPTGAPPAGPQGPLDPSAGPRSRPASDRDAEIRWRTPRTRRRPRIRGLARVRRRGASRAATG